MATKDIRWQQRFSNYKKALSKLSEAIKIIQPQFKTDTKLKAVDEPLREGLIFRFEYTQELAWNVMKDILYTKTMLSVKNKIY